MASKKMVTPLHDNVIVEKVVTKETASGIILPDSLDGATHEGVVVEVGPGRFIEAASSDSRRPMSVAVGDHVIFNRGVGTEVDFGKKYIVLPESAIICRVKDVDASKTETRKLQSA